MSEPQDLTIGGIVRTAGPVLAAAPSDLEKVKKAIDSILRTDYLPNSADGAALISKIAAVRAGIDSGLMTAEEAVDATTKLLKQFSLPLEIVGGVKVHGSGEALDVIKKASTTGRNVLEGLTTSMTQNQKIIRSVYAILAILLGGAISIASSLQQGGIVTPAGGAGLMAIFSGIKEGLAVLNSVYEGVTGTDLSK
jgi:hypothetical protein